MRYYGIYNRGVSIPILRPLALYSGGDGGGWGGGWDRFLNCNINKNISSGSYSIKPI